MLSWNLRPSQTWSRTLISRRPPIPFLSCVICETVFHVMLLAYVSSSQALRNRPMIRGTKEGTPRNSFDKWEEAIDFAIKASEKCRDAERKRETGVDYSDATAIAIGGWKLFNSGMTLQHAVTLRLIMH